MPDESVNIQAKVVVSPCFRFLGKAHGLAHLVDSIPDMITTGLTQNHHIVVVAREDAQDLLAQKIEYIARRDILVAHDRSKISLTQNINVNVSSADPEELGTILQADVSKQMRDVGADLLVYGKALETKSQGIRLDVYLLDVSTSSLRGAEGVDTSADTLSADVNAVSSRLAWAVMGYLEQRSGRPWHRTLAVLPFRNISGDSKLDNWREGLTEEFITVLKNARALQLVEREPQPITRIRTTWTPPPWDEN